MQVLRGGSVDVSANTKIHTSLFSDRTRKKQTHTTKLNNNEALIDATDNEMWHARTHARM